MMVNLENAGCWLVAVDVYNDQTSRLRRESDSFLTSSSPGQTLYHVTQQTVVNKTTTRTPGVLIERAPSSSHVVNRRCFLQISH